MRNPFKRDEKKERIERNRRKGWWGSDVHGGYMLNTPIEYEVDGFVKGSIYDSKDGVVFSLHFDKHIWNVEESEMQDIARILVKQYYGIKQYIIKETDGE